MLVMSMTPLVPKRDLARSKVASEICFLLQKLADVVVNDLLVCTHCRWAPTVRNGIGELGPNAGLQRRDALSDVSVSQN
jgi:hypothetical protein